MPNPTILPLGRVVVANQTSSENDSGSFSGPGTKRHCAPAKSVERAGASCRHPIEVVVAGGSDHVPVRPLPEMSVSPVPVVPPMAYAA